MLEIAKIKQVVGVKESSGDIEQIAEVARFCPRLAVYCGDDALALPCYALGAKGVVSVASNAYPKETVEIYNAYKNKKVKQAALLFLKALPFYKSLFTEVNPVPIKRIMAELGHCKLDVRLPLTIQ